MCLVLVMLGNQVKKESLRKEAGKLKHHTLAWFAVTHSSIHPSIHPFIHLFIVYIFPKLFCYCRTYNTFTMLREKKGKVGGGKRSERN